MAIFRLEMRSSWAIENAFLDLHQNFRRHMNESDGITLVFALLRLFFRSKLFSISSHMWTMRFHHELQLSSLVSCRRWSWFVSISRMRQETKVDLINLWWCSVSSFCQSHLIISLFRLQSNSSFLYNAYSVQEILSLSFSICNGIVIIQKNPVWLELHSHPP